VAPNWVRNGEDGSSKRMRKAARDGEIFLRQEMGDAESKQACWTGTCRPIKPRPDGWTSAPEHYRCC